MGLNKVESDEPENLFFDWKHSNFAGSNYDHTYLSKQYRLYKLKIFSTL
jgi:hypothetical protein